MSRDWNHNFLQLYLGTTRTLVVLRCPFISHLIHWIRYGSFQRKNFLQPTVCNDMLYISIPVLIVVNDNSIYICCRKRIKETCTSYIVHNLLIARTGVRFGSRVVHSSLVESYFEIFASKKVVLLYSKKLIYIYQSSSVSARSRTRWRKVVIKQHIPAAHVSGVCSIIYFLLWPRAVFQDIPLLTYTIITRSNII